MATNVEQLIAEVRALPKSLQLQVQQALNESLAANGATNRGAQDAKYQEGLVQAGLLEEVKTRSSDQAVFDRFRPVAVVGRPLSETIIQERR
jgi:hypothetical protein